MKHPPATRIGRRAFLTNGSLVLAAGLGPTYGTSRCAAEAPKPGVKIGLLTDLHFADKPSAGTRYYRETLDKLAEAAAKFKTEKPAFVVELGDLIDAADSVETELKYLKRIDKEFAALSKDRHYVLGNHCVDTLTKKEFLDTVGQKDAHYSFDRGGVHFVVLDACFKGDGKPYERKNFKWTDANIPVEQVDWLKGDLQATDKPVIVFAHQRLDVADNYGVKNAADVRTVLEGSKKVRAVFQGHSHKNDYKEIGGVHYCTLVAMIEGTGVENNGYSVLEVGPDGALTVTGFRRQKGHEWKAQRK